MLAALRDQYATLLDEFHELLGTVLTNHGATEIDRAGDGVFHSFPSARRAIAAAVESQLAIAGHTWPASSNVSVRMGILTGEVIAGRSGIVGIDIHRAARIAAAGHGGQVLLSQTTHDLVAGELPEGATLIDLGEHWLKDLAEPEHLYQINIDGLRTAFPPLRSLVTLPNNLPRHLSSFVGRRHDVEDLRQLMTESPLVTLTGPGGVGKTRLCLQVAAELLDTFSDGAWLVELETLTDGELVAQQVAVALGIAEASAADAREAVLGHLRTREALIILDNCEHLIEACARLANSILRACPGVRILATSREALGVTGERMYPVRSLSLPAPKRVTAAGLADSEAVRLFTERAQAVDPSFELTDENAAAVYEVCRRLDGIPLAVELAAARVRALSVAQIAERLDDRFRLLTGGNRTVMPRHQTLRAAIDWSFDLLSDSERTVLWRLSVFAGSFSLETAETVCAAGEIEQFEVIDHVTRLLEKSLVNRQGDRYRLLETVRGYARERALEAQEAQGAYERHLEWYREFVRQAAPAFFRGGVSADWLDRLEVEQDNLRAALGWSLNESGGAAAALELATGLWRFWEIRGYGTEARQWLDRVLAATPAEATRARADALTAAGVLAAGQGDHAAAMRLHEESLALNEQIGDRRAIEYALANLANAALHKGDVNRARSLYERVIEIGDPNDTSLAFVLVNLADVIDSQGDYLGAAQRYEEALRLFGTTGEVWTTAHALTSYGQSAARHGDYDLARQRYEQSLEIYRTVGDERGQARVMTLIADVAADEGDADAALQLLFEALKMRCRMGDAPGICAALERFSTAAADTDATRATRILAAAAAMRERTGARLSLTAQALVDQQLAHLQSHLGADFGRAWQAGAASSVDDALRDAAAMVGR